eukprot:360142-Chlamydomonas_euryale.AAC.7
MATRQPYHTTHCPLRSHAVYGMAVKGDHATPHTARFAATPSMVWPQRVNMPHYTLPASQPRRLWYGRKG